VISPHSLHRKIDCFCDILAPLLCHFSCHCHGEEEAIGLLLPGAKKGVDFLQSHLAAGENQQVHGAARDVR